MTATQETWIYVENPRSPVSSHLKFNGIYGHLASGATPETRWNKAYIYRLSRDLDYWLQGHSLIRLEHPLQLLFPGTFTPIPAWNSWRRGLMEGDDRWNPEFDQRVSRFHRVQRGEETRMVYMAISKNRGGPPKSSILIGVSIINHPFWGTTILGNTNILPQFMYINALFNLCIL